MLTNTPFFLEGSEACSHACLLLHGLGGGVYEMQLLGAYLHQQGLTVRAINYPGHDRPSFRMPASTWQQWYLHILETYLQLVRQYDRVSVVGFSTGCPLGLHLAVQHPIEKLVLLAPYMAIRRQLNDRIKPEVLLFSLGQVISEVPRLRLPIRDRTMRQQAQQALFFRSFNLAAVRSANELIALVKQELPGITVPTLIMQAPGDTIVDPAGATLIYDQLGSTEKTLIWLEQSDHIIPLDLERDRVFQEVGQFLKN
ncbi:carboxylesterase [Leptolyngbya sp. 'hensonii']|uniref:alpha/beta hydrolase n=1 Tax=Leptolyngbya sp. 'hensonii' TaxID=1922337 RepID=UPI00094F5956|nr:alpha/beta fold hydrolase [Leptolyngbya sp. 'hensonii']OLP16792.1 carboxylesterase [Leptolyngbya sp. 'hensonii']